MHSALVGQFSAGASVCVCREPIANVRYTSMLFHILCTGSLVECFTTAISMCNVHSHTSNDWARNAALFQVPISENNASHTQYIYRKTTTTNNIRFASEYIRHYTNMDFDTGACSSLDVVSQYIRNYRWKTAL